VFRRDATFLLKLTFLIDCVMKFTSVLLLKDLGINTLYECFGNAFLVVYNILTFHMI